MKPLATLLLSTAIFCAPVFAEQALFRNASIGFGGGSVLDIKAADVNHDGKQDVIVFQELRVANSPTVCSIITMFGNGDGTFGAPVKTAIASCGLIAVGDLDSDGNVDVVLSGYDGLIRVYHGNTDGSFTLRSTKTRAGNVGRDPLLADLNGDGKLDLITLPSCCGQTETFRGNGDGTFADSVLQPDFPTPLTGIVAGDFNRDGRTDMLVSTSYAGSPTLYGRQSLLTGRGDGNFNAPAVLSADGDVAAAGDFNGDLNTDYVSIGPATGFAFVHIGNGGGAFTAGATYVIGAVSHAVAVDLDGDGKLDVIAAGQDIVTVMRGNGDGTFAVNSYVAKATRFVVADFDGDHHLDVLAASDATLTFLHGNGDGSLAAYRKSFVETIATPGAEGGRISETLGELAVADFNGDGKPDIVTKINGFVIMLNRGDGGFGPPMPLTVSTTDPSETTFPVTFATADMNRDGKADIVVLELREKHGNDPYSSPYSYDVVTYLGNGDGTFHATRPTVSDGTSTDLTLHDMNGDGRPDAIISFPVLLNYEPARLLFNNGDGTFAAPIVLPRTPALIADFNGDGFADYVSNVGDATVGYVLLTNNHGSGRFTEAEDGMYGSRPIAVGDFNHDGKADLIDASSFYTTVDAVRVRLGNGDGTFTDLPQFTLGGIHNETAKTITADFDGDGNLDLAFENQVLLGKGDGTFRAIVPCIAAHPPFSSSSVELAAGDIDGNGSDDLLLLDVKNVAVSTLLTRTTAAGTTPLSLSASTSISTLHPGESVSVTVAASTSSTNVPSGGIRIDDNGVFAAFATLNNGSASAAVAPPSTGQHTFTASYIGDDVFASGSAAVTQTAVKLDADFQLEFSPAAPQVQGQTFISAHVYPKQTSTTLARGTVTIREGDSVLFTGPFKTDNNIPGYSRSTGFTYRFPTIGTHTLTLDYSGDANYPAGSVAVAVPVTKADGTVRLTTSPALLQAGQKLSLQALVTAYHNLNCCEERIDGGTVTFRDSGAVVGIATLVKGLASITIQPGAGYHSFTATYNGNVYTDPVSSYSTDYIVDAVPCAPGANCARRRAVH